VGKAIPYGVYDVGANQGFVSVGADADTAAFAVATIGRWWDTVGSLAYPQASRLLITADAGGSNGYRSRLWKRELGALAARTGLAVTVCHFPPGTSKWNRIEHRLFSHISMNWRGRPLVSHEVVVQLIGTTTTRTGLKVRAELDPGSYPTGIKAPTPNSPPCRLPAMRSTVSGTTRSPLRHRTPNLTQAIDAHGLSPPASFALVTVEAPRSRARGSSTNPYHSWVGTALSPR
jgi:hypothetical protein